MRAGCFAERRVVDLLNRRFVPYFFNRGGPGKGHDEAARKFTVGKTRNPYAYFAAFTPDGKYLGETGIYADKDAVFEWLLQQLQEHPEYAKPAEGEKQILEAADGAAPDSPLMITVARLHEELGQYDEAKKAWRGLAVSRDDADQSAEARLALMRIARYQRRWKEHEAQEERLRKTDTAGKYAIDLAVEQGHRLLFRKKYPAARDLLQPLTRKATGSPRLAEAHFHAGVACWFAGDRDWARFHWCWIVENLPDDRLYMRAYVAAAAEIMPYPNPELGNFKANGMIGTQHIVNEVERSKKIYRSLLPSYEKGEYRAERVD